MAAADVSSARDNSTHQAATYAYVGALIDEMARAGVKHACLCPGSRSTPLALTLAAQQAIRLWVHVDERSAAYFALGLARASGTPVALVCTSGTAAANFLPAVVEARYGRVPLLLLTADRPHELRDNGAPQAIDQIQLYGGNVKWFVEMPLPEASESMLRYARTTAARAAATALEEPPGPVHLNLPFREPLTPPTGYWHSDDAKRRNGDEQPPGEAALHDVIDGQSGGQPYATVLSGRRTAPREAVAELARRLVAMPRGLIVCGPQADPALAPAVARLAARLGYPVLADPLSGVRSGPHDRSMVLDCYDALLRDERAARLRPDVVLRLGATPTSKALLTYLRGEAWSGRPRDADRSAPQRSVHHVLVDGTGGWQDPTALAGEVIHADATLLCAALADEIGDRRSAGDPGWAEHWRAADRRARCAVEAYLARLDEPFEGKVFAELAALLPNGATLYAGNSMPVRDLETFFPGTDRDVRFLGNRGANGIDGVVSSALGAAAACGPLVLVVGDLSFYHDLNGLLAAKRHGLDATIVVLNNDGGGIFSFLPQAVDVTHFEELFGTPTGLDFRLVVEMYGCRFERVATWPEFRAATSASLTSPGVQVIEMRTDRTRNVALHRAVWAAVAEAVWHA